MVTWRRAQMVLLSAQGMDVAKIAEVTFTSPDRVRDAATARRHAPECATRGMGLCGARCPGWAGSAPRPAGASAS